MDSARMTENGIQGLFDIDELQILQNQFGRSVGVYLYCLDSAGQQITVPYGTEEDWDTIRRIVSLDEVEAIYSRVTENGLEDQAMESSSCPGLYYGAVSVKIKGQSVITWILFGVCESGFEAPDEQLLGMKEHIRREHLDGAMDLLREGSTHLMHIRMSGASAQAESRRSKFSEAEMSQTLRRMESITDIVRLMDQDDERTEVILNRFLAFMGQYLEVDTARVYQIHLDDENKMDVIAQWLARGVASEIEFQKNLPRFSYLNGDSVLSLSSGSDTIEMQWAWDMKSLNLQAIVVEPIFVNGKVRMYVVLGQSRRERVWDVDELRFINDGIRILQNIVTRRVQKNSLASSFASLEAVLDNVGSAIYVRDIATGNLQFVNRTLKQEFAEEYKSDRLAEIFETPIPEGSNLGSLEIYYEDKEHWYELYYTKITWMTGRPGMLCSIHEVTEKKQYQKRIEQLAYTDYLTGLFNRMCCERDLAIYIDQAENTGTEGALMYLDLDDFKHINDGLGHKYGDVLLQSIAHSVNRIEGIKGTCYRMGGDEFVIILPPDKYEYYESVLQSITDVFSRPWYLKDTDYYCTMSMGVIHFPTEGNEVQDLIKKADVTMYEAKKGGKNRIAVYSSQSDAVSSRRLEMEKHMREAVSSGFEQFEVYYQPIVDISEEGNPCCGAEALLRWNNPVLGFISPVDFIPLAEYLELIIPIGKHVLREACKACKYWNSNGYPKYKVNVNLSVVQLLQADIVEQIEEVLLETGLNPGHLTLEVTESLAINDMAKMQDVLGRIRELGVRFALDDFGIGYSSLSHLRQLPLDVIKIDRSFIIDLTKEAYSQAFVRMVATLAKTLGMSVCVEGIETQEQFEILGDMGARMIQGYYFDKPMPGDKFIEKYIV